jgi:uncharacterized protein
VSQDPRAIRLLIEAYGDGGFRVATTRHDGAILIARTRLWRLGDLCLADIGAATFEPLFEEMPDAGIILLGTGIGMRAPPVGLRADLKARGAVLETMATGAACRTFNVLSGEGRVGGTASDFDHAMKWMTGAWKQVPASVSADLVPARCRGAGGARPRLPNSKTRLRTTRGSARRP